MKTFLQLTRGSREACLMICDGEDERAEAAQMLENSGFSRSSNVRHIFNAIRDGKKTYFTLEEKLGNNIYGILAQYPTGQVTAHDGQRNLVANPNYHTGAVVVLVTKQHLQEIEHSGKSLLRSVGLTWQR